MNIDFGTYTPEQLAKLAPGLVIEMRMCEQNCVVLKPNQLYLFTVDQDCQACKDAAAFATGMSHEH